MKNIEKYKKSLTELNTNLDIKIQLLSKETKDEWDVICEKSCCNSEYEWFNNKYQNEYFNQEDNYSLLILWKCKPVCLWPLMFDFSEDGLRIKQITSLGGSILEPLLLDGIPQKVKKYIVNYCFSILDFYKEIVNIPYQYRVDCLKNASLSSWSSLLFSRCSQVEPIKLAFVDLSKPLDEIKLNFRKSYRSLVNQGLKNWKIEIQTEVTDDFDIFHKLHIQVAGRITRSEQTWQWQKEMLKHKKAFLVTIKDEGEIIGGGLFMHNHYHCYYGVGVYRRDYFPQPLGHVVQYKAIEYMQSIKLKWYEIGEVYSSINNPTKKLKDIGEFKSGFATDLFTRLIFKSE